MIEHNPNNLTPTDHSSDGDFWTDLPEQLKQAIETAKKQLDNGEGIPHQQVMDEVKARFLNK